MTSANPSQAEPERGLVQATMIIEATDNVVRVTAGLRNASAEAEAVFLTAVAAKAFAISAACLADVPRDARSPDR